jgi:hypothetical protein
MKKLSLLFAASMLYVFAAVGQPELHWRFANPVVFDNGTNCVLQFDVEVAATVAATYHSSMQVYIDYDNTAFGPNVVASGNASYARLGLLQGQFSGIDKYIINNFVDNTDHTYAILSEASFLIAGSTFMNEVPLYPTFGGYAQFTMIIGTQGPPAGIYLRSDLMDGGEYYIDATHPNETKYGIPPAYAGYYDNDLLAQSTVCAVPCEPIPYTEDFDEGGAWPAGWSTDNPSVWYLDATWYGSLTPPTGYHVTSAYWSSGIGTTYSPCFDGTGKTDIHVRFYNFWYSCYPSTSQDGYFYGSPDGGTTVYLLEEWHSCAPTTYEAFSEYDIDWADGASNIVFWWYMNMNGDWFWQVDDFAIQEGPFPGLPGSWIGVVSTDWFDPQNWDDGTVPSITTAVTIPAGCPFYPVLTSGAAQAASVAVNGGSLTALGGTLMIDSFFDIFGEVDVDGGAIDAAGDMYTEPGSILNVLSGSLEFNVWAGGPANFWGDGTITLAGGTITAHDAVRFGYATVNMTGPFTMYVGGDYRIWDNWNTTDGTVVLTGESLPGGTFVFESSAWGGYYLIAWNLIVNTTDPTTVYAMAFDDPGAIYDYLWVQNNFSVQSGTVNTHNNQGYSAGWQIDSFFDVYMDANFVSDALSPGYLDGDVTIHAGPGGYGAWIDDANITYAKNPATAQVYMNSTMWHMISSPISDAVSGLFLWEYLQGFDEATNTWSDIIPVNIPLVPMNGYAHFVDYDKTVNFVGTLNTGPYAVPLTRIMLGWNAVGNPYPSPIDWDAALGWVKTNVADATYIESNGNWATYIGGVGTNGGSQYIAPGQGFFVECTDGGGGGLGVNKEARTTVRATYFKNSVGNMIRLQASGNNFTDETVVVFNDQATTGFDYNYDARKMFAINENIPQIYSLDNGNMSINALPSTEMVSLGFKAVDGSYTISATEINDLGYAMLEDLETGAMTDLTTSSYTFTHNSVSAEARFILHFAPVSVPELNAGNISIYSYGHNVYVYVPENTEGSIVVYNMLGQQVLTAPINNVTNTLTLDNSGSYIVKVLGESSIITQKVVIE